MNGMRSLRLKGGNCRDESGAEGKTSYLSLRGRAVVVKRRWGRKEVGSQSKK